MAGKAVTPLAGGALVLLLAGCSWFDPEPPEPPPPKVVEVKVPVPVRPEPPAELREPYPLDDAPAFVPPDHPDAVVALTAEGEHWVFRTISRLHARDRAWRAWATEPMEEGPSEDGKEAE